MSETESAVTQVGQEIPLSTDQPAVGLVATADNGPDIAAAILRAHANEHQAVVAGAVPNTEGVDYAEQLGAIFVELPPELGSTTEQERLVQVCREIGFPGLLYQSNSAHRIDFQRSIAALSQTDRYSIDAITRETGGLDQRILVGIPAYNEEVGIGSVILGAKEFADEVVVVDDGSCDRTVEVARCAGATVIKHTQNKGKGAAIQSLFDYVDTLDYEALVLLDGDGQHATEDIDQVVRPVLDEEADLVIGSRYLKESVGDETPRYRRFGQRVLDTLTIGSSRTSVSDSQSGFRALSPTAIEELALTADSFGVETEMIDSASQKGLQIQEQPIDVRYEGIDGQTQNPFRHGLSVVTFILMLVRDRHPLLFFGLPGLLLLSFGGIYGMDAVLVYQSTGAFYPAKVLVSGFMTILGTLGLFIGLVLNRIGNMLQGLGEFE